MTTHLNRKPLGSQPRWNSEGEAILEQLKLAQGAEPLTSILFVQLEAHIAKLEKDREAALSITRGQRMEITELEREIKHLLAALTSIKEDR